LDAKGVPSGTHEAEVTLFFDGHTTTARLPITVDAAPPPTAASTTIIYKNVIPKPFLYGLIVLLLLAVIIFSIKSFLPGKAQRADGASRPAAAADKPAPAAAAPTAAQGTPHTQTPPAAAASAPTPPASKSP
jgi:hypothetical protein